MIPLSTIPSPPSDRVATRPNCRPTNLRVAYPARFRDRSLVRVGRAFLRLDRYTYGSGPVVKAVRKALELICGIALSAVLLTLALPLGEQGYLAWVALFPLLRAVRKTNFIVGFVSAILLMFAIAALTSSGVFFRFKSPSDDPSWLYSACGIFGFAVAMATAFAADKKLADRPIWWFAAIAVVGEALLLLQMPGNIALTQYRNSFALLIASLVGIWGVSFLIWLANLHFARAPWRSLAWQAPALIAVSFAGTLWKPGVSGETLKVALLQFPNDDENQIRANHAQAAAQGAKLVVWPEFAGMIFASNTVEQDLAGLSKVVPFVTSFREPHEPLPFNSAALFMAGSRSETYRKQKLFGAEVKMHTPGEKNISVPFGDISLGLNICYDSCFPAIMRDSARKAEMVVLPTNDPESPHHFMAAMHSAFTPFRAAENGIPMVRCDSLAYSHAVNSWGAIVAEAPPGGNLLVADVPLGRHWTIASLLGDPLLLGAALVLVVVGARRRVRES